MLYAYISITKDRKYKKIANKSHRTLEYNNWTGKLHERGSTQTRQNRRKDEWIRIQGSGSHPIWEAKRKKNMNKPEDSKRDHETSSGPTFSL